MALVFLEGFYGICQVEVFGDLVCPADVLPLDAAPCRPFGAQSVARFRRSIPTRRSPLFRVCSTTRFSSSSDRTPENRPCITRAFMISPHFLIPVGRKVDLGRPEDRRDPCINGTGEVNVHVADDHDDANPGSLICLMRAEQRVEHFIDLILIEEIIRIIKRDKQDNFLFYQMPGNRIEDLLERGARGRGEVANEFLVDL